jgi:hypothetical protein
MSATRLTVKVCVERMLPDGSWAPEHCYAGLVEFVGDIKPADTLSIGHAAQQAAEALRQDWQAQHDGG